MIAARYEGPPEYFKVGEEKVPEIEAGDLLVKVGAVGICSTDAKIILGKRNIKTGLVLGHEIAGEIIDFKDPVKLFNRGDIVGAFPGMACKECYYCTLHLENLCMSKVSLGLQIDGGFQQYMRVPSRILENGNVMKLPGSITLEE